MATVATHAIMIFRNIVFTPAKTSALGVKRPTVRSASLFNLTHRHGGLWQLGGRMRAWVRRTI
jgi:hypothetical protein